MGFALSQRRVIEREGSSTATAMHCPQDLTLAHPHLIITSSSFFFIDVEQHLEDDTIPFEYTLDIQNK